jgi:hypothetical protein
MAYKDQDPDAWEGPVALPRSQWPSGDPDELGEDELGETEWDRAFDEKGAEGYRALLLELAAYLETPLVVLLGLSDLKHCSARAWIVQPGAKEVETLVVALGD